MLHRRDMERYLHSSIPQPGALQIWQLPQAVHLEDYGNYSITYLEDTELPELRIIFLQSQWGHLADRVPHCLLDFH